MVSCLLSVWLHFWSLDNTVNVGGVGIVAAASTYDQVCLLVDVGVVRVEVLAIVVVEDPWLPIVLHHNLAEGTHILAVLFLVLMVHVALGTQPGVVIDAL